MKTNTLFTLLVLIVIAACSEAPQEESTNSTAVTSDTTANEVASSTGITPPVPSVDVPYMKKTLNAENGGVLVYETGSIVSFPANAVLYSDGSPVEGDFEVEYREFHDPIDIFFSGIPMGYDSAGISYNFISAGMCELKASQNGQELMVNPGANPTVDMVSKDSNPAHNLYYYNENEEAWIPKGKSVIEDIPEPTGEPIAKEEEPAKPKKKDPSKHSFFITIDETMKDVSEYAGFDQMHFQIADQEKGYNPADAKKQWTGVAVKKSDKFTGKYLVTFTGVNITKTYLTDPVFSEEQYEQAMAHYNKVMAEYEANLKQLKAEQAEWEAQQAAIIAQNRKIDSMNEIIAQRNAETIAYNKQMAKAKAKMDSLEKLTLNVSDAEFTQNLYTVSRGFALSSFGTWNCDNPMFVKEGFVATNVTFKGFEDSTPAFTVIYKKHNSVFPGNYQTFRNLPNTHEIIFIVQGNALLFGIVKDDALSKTVDLEIMDLTNVSFNEVKKQLMTF
jgi:hypothetical protein